MAFAPEKTHYNDFQTTLGRPRSAIPSSDIYGVKHIVKTPSAAELAYNVMKKIHRAAGENTEDRGRSLYEKLAYIKTEPTVQLLSNKTWRAFFEEYERNEMHPHQHREGREHERERPEFRTQKGGESGYSSSHQQQHHQPPPGHRGQSGGGDNEINYPRLFHKLVKRTYSLWRELHFPDSDRDFYSYALLQGPFRSPEQIDELACYVKKVKEHRESTILVLSAIDLREKCVIRCTELIASAHRSAGMKFVSSTLHDEVKRRAEREAGGGVDQELAAVREEILGSLAALRSASVEVVRAVQAWRRELWRPHPFVWRGQNYLVKMSSDMDFVRSDTIRRLLSSLQIPQSDLVGVVFDAPVETGASSASQQLTQMASSSDFTGNHQETSNGGVGGSPSREPLRPGGQGSAVFGEDDGEEEEEGGGAPSPLSDVDASVAVVMEEETLQRALVLEKKALMSRGAFIPLLKFDMENVSSSVCESKLEGNMSRK